MVDSAVMGSTIQYRAGDMVLLTVCLAVVVVSFLVGGYFAGRNP
jgi:hypothetical protein